MEFVQGLDPGLRGPWLENQLGRYSAKVTISPCHGQVGIAGISVMVVVFVLTTQLAHFLVVDHCIDL